MLVRCLEKGRDRRIAYFNWSCRTWGPGGSREGEEGVENGEGFKEHAGFINGIKDMISRKKKVEDKDDQQILERETWDKFWDFFMFVEVWVRGIWGGWLPSSR